VARTDGKRDSTSGSASGAARLLSALEALDDFAELGTVRVRDRELITLPAEVRRDFGLEKNDFYYLYGSASLGLLILVGQRRSPRDHLGFQLGQSPPSP
jgi:hypothetical protein